MWSWLVRVGLLSIVVFALAACLSALRPAAASPALLADEDEAQGEAGEQGLADWLGEQHVAIIHFPIALTIAAALAEVIALITRKPAFAHAARFCIVIAALGAIAAFISGVLEFPKHAGEPDHDVLVTHRLLGLITAPLIVIAAVVSEIGHIGRNKRVLWAYRLVLLAAVVLVSFAGYYGGRFVFGGD
jgi:uncharacterized membrane protein